MRQVLTPSQAANHLKLSTATIYRHISSGKLKSEQIDGKLHVILDDENCDAFQESDVEAEHSEVIKLLQGENQRLIAQLEEKDRQIEELHQIVAMGQKNIASLTEQVKLLEDKRNSGWWQRLKAGLFWGKASVRESRSV